MDVIISAAGWCLVSLSKLTLASSSALTLYSSGRFPCLLNSQILLQATAKNHTTGSSRWSSRSSWSLTTCWSWCPASWGMQCMTAWPTPWLPGHLSRACTRSSWTLVTHNLHWPLTVELVLDSLSWVGSRSCITLNKKLVDSDPRPASLALDQMESQSNSGFLISGWISSNVRLRLLGYFILPSGNPRISQEFR